MDQFSSPGPSYVFCLHKQLFFFTSCMVPQRKLMTIFIYLWILESFWHCGSATNSIWEDESPVLQLQSPPQKCHLVWFLPPTGLPSCLQRICWRNQGERAGGRQADVGSILQDLQLAVIPWGCTVFDDLFIALRFLGFDRLMNPKQEQILNSEVLLLQLYPWKDYND